VVEDGRDVFFPPFPLLDLGDGWVVRGKQDTRKIENAGLTGLEGGKLKVDLEEGTTE
jgi:hypothetical protein